jgi:hypothetical protein
MKTKFTSILLKASAIYLFVFMATNLTFGQTEDLTTPGTVWELTFVKINPHSGDKYITGLKQTWKSSMDEFVKAGLVKSYKILWGDATNEDDFDMLLMVEYENFGAFDPNPERDKKFDEINKKIKDALGDEYTKIVEGYDDLRELRGSKVMRQITIN